RVCRVPRRQDRGLHVRPLRRRGGVGGGRERRRHDGATRGRRSGGQGSRRRQRADGDGGFPPLPRSPLPRRGTAHAQGPRRLARAAWLLPAVRDLLTMVFFTPRRALREEARMYAVILVLVLLLVSPASAFERVGDRKILVFVGRQEVPTIDPSIKYD